MLKFFNSIFVLLWYFLSYVLYLLIIYSQFLFHIKECAAVKPEQRVQKLVKNLSVLSPNIFLRLTQIVSPIFDALINYFSSSACVTLHVN